MGEKHMRIPWIATLDALIEELKGHLDGPNAEVLEQRSIETDPGRQGLGLAPHHQDDGDAAQVRPDCRITSSIRMLLAARDELRRVEVSGLAASKDPHFYQLAFGSLDELDERAVRYPEQAGREGLARFIERGGLIGPILGRHVAAILRGETKFGRGDQQSFEEGRKRRFAVKRIATIQHLYDVSLKKAVEMFCSVYGDDDPRGSAHERYRQWVRRDRQRAKEALDNQELDHRKRRHFRSILSGLYADEPRGLLKGKPFPEALEELMKQRRR